MSSKKPNTQLDPSTKNFLESEDFKSSANYGVTPDVLNYKKLFGLTLAGIILVVGLVYFSMVLFDYYAFKASQDAAINAVFYEIEELRAKDASELTTFGVINDEEGIFRIPVDSAMTLVLEKYKN